jgi:hypothetical protein
VEVDLRIRLVEPGGRVFLERDIPTFETPPATIYSAVREWRLRSVSGGVHDYHLDLQGNQIVYSLPVPTEDIQALTERINAARSR